MSIPCRTVNKQPELITHARYMHRQPHNVRDIGVTCMSDATDAELLHQQPLPTLSKVVSDANWHHSSGVDAEFAGRHGTAF